MARAAVTIYSGVLNGAVTVDTATSIDASDGMYIPAGDQHDRIMLFVDHSTSVARTMTVKASQPPTGYTQANWPPSFRAASDVTIGLNISNASPKSFIGPFESAMFFNPASIGTSGSAGDILLDFSANTTGTIYAVKLPVGSGG